MTDPDAWKFKHHRADMQYKYSNSEPISSRLSEKGIKKPLFSAESIQEETEKLSKAPYVRSSTSRSDMSTKEAAYFEKGFAAAISQIQEIFKEEAIEGENEQ